ncbi:MAG TPA: polysaccharide pyruvyl transferase family protein [Actinomycetaceae bacterium]|nr:polysaccharide pyruvyl transferase family protein [Actinomycetaceae bacterium]
MAKQVGIMSMQRIVNYGSSLQAYGLKRLVEEVDPSATVRFVDYRPGHRAAAEDAAHGLSRKLSALRKRLSVEAPVVDRLRYYNQMRQHALGHRRHYAAKNFAMLGIPASPDHDLSVDLQIIGSDEVFNCLQENPDVGYSRDLFGHGSRASRLVSYAASFGNTTVDKLAAAGLADEVAADLARFAHISVRDQNSADVITSLVGQVPEIHVDPVLAYDFMAEESAIPTRRMHDREYLIVYAYPGRLSAAENEAIRRFADGHGLEVLAFGGAHLCADRFIDCDPFELLAYFRDAAAVVTDTFHGTIFSLINTRPFITLVRTSVGHGYGNEEKLGHLLRTFGLERRGSVEITDLARRMAEPIDYSQVAQGLARERERSRRYLAAVLADDVVSQPS